MWTIIWLALAAAPAQARNDPGRFPLALHRSMELDDLDREIRRQHDMVLVKRAELASTRTLARKGAVPPMDLAREEADVRYQEAREAEMVAYRAMKQYEHDVLARKTTADDAQGYSLLLDLLKKQETMASIELEYRTYTFKHVKLLKERNAASREEEEAAELDYHSAKAALALARAREAQVSLELAMRVGEKNFDRNEQYRLQADYQKALVTYAEVVTAGAKSRLEHALARGRGGEVEAAAIESLRRAYNDAIASLNKAKKDLEDLKPPKPPSTVRTL